MNPSGAKGVHMDMVTWIQAHSALLLTGLGVLSVATFVLSLIALPILVARLPEDYFVARGERPFPWQTDHPIRNTVLVVGRNVLGAILVLGGIAMLFLPGQGLLTIAIGLLMLDLPRKKALEAWVLSWKPIHKGLDWLRRKANKPALRLQ